MQDSWTVQIAALHGAFVAPPARWPAARVRHVVDGKTCRAPIQPRSAPAGLRRRATDREIVAHVNRTGAVTATALAAALHCDFDTAVERLRRLAAAGALRRDGNAWHIAG